MNLPEQNLEELLRTLISTLCPKAGGIRINLLPQECFEVQIANGDEQGRCVGHKGTVLWAISAVMWHAGFEAMKTNYMVDLLEPPGGKVVGKKKMPFLPDPNWSRLPITNLIHRVLPACCPQSAWTMEDQDPGEALVRISLPAYFQVTPPNLAQAMETILHAAGRAHGATIETEVSWS